MTTALGRDWLLAHLPHQGAMNLLDRIERWDAGFIQARALGHSAADNPLRRNGALPVTAAIEYAAQAAAAHGALTSGKPSPGGYLASLRGVAFHARRIDDVPELEIVARQVGAGEAGVLYQFEVRAGGRPLAEGRLAVAFAA